VSSSVSRRGASEARESHSPGEVLSIQARFRSSLPVLQCDGQLAVSIDNSAMSNQTHATSWSQTLVDVVDGDAKRQHFEVGTYFPDAGSALPRNATCPLREKLIDSPSIRVAS